MTEKKMLRARSAEDHLHEIAMQMDDGRVQRTQDVDAVAYATMGAVEMISQYDTNCMFPHRPALAFTGEVQALTGDIAEGVSAVAFSAGSGIPVRFVYDFSAAELAELGQKGLFEPGFDMPDLFLNTTFELPVKCTVDVIEAEVEGGAPVVFCDIQQKQAIPANAATSGYVLADYFDNAIPVPEKESVLTREPVHIEEMQISDISDELEDGAMKVVEEVQQKVDEINADPVEPLYAPHVTEAEEKADAIFAKVLSGVSSTEVEAVAEMAEVSEPVKIDLEARADAEAPDDVENLADEDEPDYI